ncbi:sel1 repeat family protein, partial [Xanthomonas citri pv. citri]|nr:sel1 repeat family protein [Xanthomonas citri pv. citri]
AINNLAAMFVNGTGVARDMQQAVNLFERAAQLGNAEAAENAARIYNYGIGRGKDPSRARTWYRKAIELGSVRAAQELSD